MKALVYTGPNSLAFRDEPDPVPGNDEVVVRVEAVGICGSDMHAYHGHDSRRPAPLILGHEAAGRIATGPKAGRRVTVNPLVTCGACDVCQDGRSHLCASRQILSMMLWSVRSPNSTIPTVRIAISVSNAKLAF